MKVWIAHEQGLAHIGPLPAEIDIEVYADPAAPPPSDPAGVTFWVPPFLGSGDVVGLAAGMPDLRVIQLLSAGADAWLGRIPAGVTLHDARGVHDSPTSEWILTAVLSSLRRFDDAARAQGEGRWASAELLPTDELAGKRVLIVGAGSIGRATAARLAPFEVTITEVARSARPGVHGVDDLPHLLPSADIVILIVPLTSETRGLVDEKFLAAMPDGALLVNAARGPVVQTDALVAELSSGRLRAAMDVTDPEPLPPGHPLWTTPNTLITPHTAGSVHGLFGRAYRLAGVQLRRHIAGEPLINQVVGDY
ncbi:phosphoglycerate dehydrogenase-like enzyme [Allocatelliglobosispora scoriae]|uniref:Phosphoglycerate dehydrogenase-like enzyme n=1 Tax=Allocatelliglobosispora scoriae TaxID=643052 RepID=A0A841BSM5_9ACTN|nr:2-hydroxyacid dehydrogenase [Allocatelliglobosispora scoriae]MBB5869923.1 phosphoglycerate dehydrogenase-like enzyme [Allocatelliglobosispora scoriae]